MNDIILMYFFDTISMDGKSTQFQRASFIVFLKDKNHGRFSTLQTSLRYFKNQSRLAVSFRCNLGSMYLHKVILFHLELS